MLANLVRGDILATDHRHLVLGVNAEGFDDAGFAGLVAHRFWPELENTGPQQLGAVLSKTVGDRTFHAVVCHKLERGGWAQAPRYVEEAMNRLDVPQDVPLGVVLMGGGPVGQMGGADVFAILGALARSNKTCHVYTL